MIPGTYAIAIGFYFYAVVSFVTTVVSINYWRHAIDGYRRTADLITAKASFVIYFVSGCLFIRDVSLLAIGIVGCASIIFFYNLANMSWNNDESIWVAYHMMFHLSVAFEQYLVLYSGELIAGGKHRTLYFVNNTIQPIPG
jgi:hypothetical protein